MSFSGKKFRKVKAENVEELLKLTKANENITWALQQTTPVFSFTRLDADTFDYCLISGDRSINTSFKLGQETEMECRDRYKVKLTYTLEGDNILKQVIKTPDGTTSYFKKQFCDKGALLTISMDGADIEAKIYYECVE